jgi:two-component system response regulator HydG
VPDFDTRDPAFRRLLQMAERAARSQANVLLTGESGTGKNRLAAFLHERSPRAAGPFVDVPCANVPADLLESDLFGHEKGAFTDAHEARTGRFERAAGGTLYFDEIQELEPGLQAKVLRAIDEKRFERLGGNRTVEVDVRILASTREDPARLVGEGRLREDLFYRLDVVRLALPPLRDRRADIPVLAQALLDETVSRHRLPPRRLAPGAVEVLLRHAWPGNVRELGHAIEAAAVLAEGETIGEADLPGGLSLASPLGLRSAASGAMSLDVLEHAYIDEVLRRTRGNKSAAARILGIHRKTLHERLRARQRPAPATTGGGDDDPSGEAGE